MGHNTAKDIYRKLGDKIDALAFRAPWNETFREILKELYSEDEAELLAAMPSSYSTFDTLKSHLQYPEPRLRNLLDGMAEKGLVMDMWLRDSYYYAPSPLVVGIFELTMMRTEAGQDWKKISRLFHDYMLEQKDFIEANCSHGEKIGLLRTIPHESTVSAANHVEVLDYEKASALVESQTKFSIGTCSCRHTALHTGTKSCTTPLDTCSSFGIAAEFMIRRGFGREVSKTEMHENVARSRELGLVLNVDNVQRNPAYLCHCCSDCCHLLVGMKKWGCTNVVITSSFLPETDYGKCTGCGLCAKACPVESRTMVPEEQPAQRRKRRPSNDESFCLGCGVCSLRCASKAITLTKMDRRVITPATTFERVILQCLERGTLQNQLFSDPHRLTHRFMRGIMGGFLRLTPVKRSLMSDMLRSRFLSAMKTGADLQGRGWMADL